jgi:hypothetical protein
MLKAELTGHTPDQLDLPFALWGLEAVRDLVRTIRYAA